MLTSLADAVYDSRTMLRRNLRHLVRYPSMTVTLVAFPIVFLLLFVFVFGATLGTGLGGGAGGRTEYVDYVTPTIMVMTVATAVQGTAVAVSMDMTEGIIDRFRTMAVSPAAVLTGHVVGSLLHTLASTAVVTAVALLVGFRPAATLPAVVAAVGLLTLVTFALTWLAVAFGLLARSPETASNMPMFLVLLPFLGSGFVPTDSMPAGLRWFAEYQPFTPIIDTLRALLLGNPAGAGAALAVAWSAGIALLGYLWARWLYRRNGVRA